MIGLMLTTFNHWLETKNTLESLRKNTQTEYKLLVVDNNSQDETIRELKSYNWLEVLSSNDFLHLSEALNKGLKIYLNDSSISYIGWIHNDMEFYPGWLTTLAAVLRKNPKVGKLAPLNIGNRLSTQEVELWMKLNNSRMVTGNACPWLMRKEAVKEIGFFDERYLQCGGYEDWDYNNRLLQVGWQVRICHGSVVYHPTMGTRKYNDQDQWGRHNAQIYYDKWGQWTPRV